MQNCLCYCPSLQLKTLGERNFGKAQLTSHRSASRSVGVLGIARASRLAVAHPRLGTASLFRLLAQHSSGVRFQTYDKLLSYSPLLHSIQSGCWESNPVLTNPNRAYYRCTTPRNFITINI